MKRNRRVLAQRVTDSHECKAAVELTELHQELAKLGFVRKEKTSPPVAADVRPDFRQQRPLRATRLSPVQRLAQLVNDVRRRLGLERTEAVAEKTATAEKTMPAEKISPANETKKTPAGTAGESASPNQTNRAAAEPVARHPNATLNPPNTMSFPTEQCYHAATTYAAFIEFHFDANHRRAFNASQLIECSLDPNPDAADDKNAPPQKIAFTFSTADVAILGRRLGQRFDYLRDNRLAAVAIHPKRHVELERATICVSAITITPVEINNVIA